MARARSGGLVKSKIQMIVFGQPFTGKSTLASQFAYMKNPDGSPFKVLYIDPESGSIDDYLEDLENNGVNLQNIYIVYTQSLAETIEYIKKAKNHEDFYVLDEDGNETDEIVLDGDGKPFRPDAIVVDGASILNITTKQGLIDFSKRRAAVRADDAGLIGDKRNVKVEGAGLEFKDYQTINFKGQDLILTLTGSGLHYIVTARETDEKVQKEVGNKVESVCTGKKIPEGFKEMDFNAKTVLRMYRDKDDYETVKAFVVKDRTRVHGAGEIIENPTLLDWQTVIDKTAKNKDFVIHNNLHEAIEIEKKMFEKENDIQFDSNNNNSSDVKENDVENIKKEIKTLIKNLTPPVQAKARAKLKELGLPTAFSKEKDIDVLKKVVEVLQGF